MTLTELTMFGLLLLIAAQTTYASYRSRHQTLLRRAHPVFIDTSVLMDGRIIPIAQAGFMPGSLVIPRSVIGELQFLADNSDSEKRERARLGLDVVRQLQEIEHLEVEILQDGSKAEEGVDERLLSLAKKYNGILCTIDFNLNKVAHVEGLQVLNVNELAQQLRMSYLPGDKLKLDLTTAGSDNHQAVGHLADGTMVVVEHAKAKIGKTVEIEIIRSLQTAAGRMMFARLSGDKLPNNSSGKSLKKPSTNNVQSLTKAKTARVSGLDYEHEKLNKVSTKTTSHKRSVAQQPSRSSKRRPSSAQREASLVDLIDQQ